jgi:MFS family permease
MTPTVPNAPQIGIWRNAAFVRLWVAQAVSNAGSQITAVALPLTAVLVLGATPAQMAVLGIASRAPGLLFDLFAGVWVDRTRRRPILVGADLGRALLLATIPLAAFFGALSLVQLYAVAFLTSTLTSCFTLASISILPSLVRREQLVQANSALAVSDSVVQIAGPGMAGGLVQFVGAPKAIVADALSFLASALALKGIRVAEQPPSRAARRSVWAEIGEGIRELVRTPVLRALAVSVGVGTAGLAMQETVLLIYLTRELGFGPAMIGLVYGLGGAGALVGASLSGRAARWLGVGPAIVFGNLLWALGVLVVPFAGASVVLIAGGEFLARLGATLWSVNQMSLRQQITPVGLFARATAARRVLLFGMQIAGAALGGVLGTIAGSRATLVLGAVVMLTSVLLIWRSPVRAVVVPAGEESQR